MIPLLIPFLIHRLYRNNTIGVIFYIQSPKVFIGIDGTLAESRLPINHYEFLGAEGAFPILLQMPQVFIGIDGTLAESRIHIYHYEFLGRRRRILIL